MILPTEIIIRILSFVDFILYPLLYYFFPFFFKQPPTNHKLETLLLWAAENGKEDLCRFAKKLGARDFIGMAYKAARSNHENLCYLAKKWMIHKLNEIDDDNKKIQMVDFSNWVLYGAARSNNLSLCYKAKKWGAIHFEAVCYIAQESKNEQLYIMATNWMEEKEEEEK